MGESFRLQAAKAACGKVSGRTSRSRQTQVRRAPLPLRPLSRLLVQNGAMAMKLAFGWVLFCLLAATGPTGAAAAETYPGIEAEIAFRSVYAKEKGHKALAISPGGDWTSVFGKSSATAAKKEALRQCSYWLRQRPWGRESKCEIFAINDKIVWAKPLPGPPLGKALPLPDVPLGKARVFTPDTGKVTGLVLALHGCGKPWRGTWPFEESWFDFFRARGLQVYYPNSYNDPMPTEQCGWASPDKHDLVTAANKIRIAQAKRSIGELRRRNPGLPIYVWAHSGGGNIAQALDDDLAGIFIVGTRCGIGSSTLELVRPTVPVLFVFGDKDDRLVNGYQKITAKLMNKQCGSYYRTKNRKWVIAADGSHRTTIWRQDTLDAVTAVLGQKSFRLAAAMALGAIDGEAKQAFEKDYRLRPVKKAFAVGPNGIFAIGADWDSQEDAIQNALYSCARRAGARSYVEGGAQTCRLYAIGDKVVATGN